MRQFTNRLSEIIDDSDLRLNRISKMSGISHTYLTKLIQGNINRPGKDKIASILLALNYSISEINAILAKYDYLPLNHLDIPSILINNKKRKIEGNTLSMYDSIHMRLLLSPMERVGGAKILIKGFPSVLYMPDELYIEENKAMMEDDPEANAFRLDLTRALFNERKINFRKWCRERNISETFICKKCFDDHLHRSFDESGAGKSAHYRELVVKYFANVIHATLLHPMQHQIKIMERCTYFNYFIQNAGSDQPKLFFLGRKLHAYEQEQNPSLLGLEGFTSDSPAMISLFSKETDICRMAVDKSLDCNYPDTLVEYFYSCFDRYGMGDRLRAAVAAKSGDEDFLR